MENFPQDVYPTPEEQEEMARIWRAILDWIREKMVMIFGSGSAGSSSSAPGGAAKHHQS